MVVLDTKSPELIQFILNNNNRTLKPKLEIWHNKGAKTKYPNEKSLYLVFLETDEMYR